MKLGSSPGMDTKRPRGSERSKPWQLQLTRRWQPPYPWPPEQAQPGVSKPCRTTVRQLEGNGVAERFIRTLKENLLWVRTFKTIEELRAELGAFARRYNETWLVARHRYKTPSRVREEQTMPQIAIDPTFAATLPLAA